MTPTQTPTAEQALKAHGFDGDKLIAYARTIARRELQRKGSTLGDRHEDLVMYLVELGCRKAVTYNPAKSSPSYTFSSYLYDIMARRVPDFYRSKSEGFGDKRRNQHDRLHVTSKPGQTSFSTAAGVYRLHTDDDPPSALVDDQTDALARLIDQDTLTRYTKAAERAGLTLATWVHTTLEAAA